MPKPTPAPPCRPLSPLRLACLLLLVVLMAGLVLPVPVTLPSAMATPALVDKQDDTQNAEEAAAERQRRLAEQQAELEARNRVGLDMFATLSDAYLKNRWDEVAELSREMRRHRRVLTPEQRRELDYITRNYEVYRPGWWRNLSRMEENSFEAEIWGREFWANYYPTDELGLQAVIPETRFNRETGEVEVVDLKIIVTWKPHLVDNENPAEGRLSRIHDYRLGDLAEFICWHELGHNYITQALPTAANIELYESYSELYSTLHEYFADLTALYHCSPRARRVVLMFRLEELDHYDPHESHRRGEHGIGAILMADMLANPEDWPSVHFPPSVPEQQVELNTIIYVYENLSTEWTVAEDIRLRGIAEEYVQDHGERTFRSKGEVRLPNRLRYYLMVEDDAEAQQERDEWVARKLTQLAEQGRTDTLAEGETYDPPLRTHQRQRPRRPVQLDDDDPNAPLRITVPW